MRLPCPVGSLASLVLLGWLGGCGGAPPPEPKPAPVAAKPSPAPEPVEVEEEDDGDLASGGDDSECPKGMVKVEGGLLWLGSPEGSGKKDEHPQSQVTVKSFCLDETEVTVADYEACTQNGICEPAPTTVREGKALSEAEVEKRSAKCTARLEASDQLPVNCVAFEEAASYCKWKARRLPTEPELEFASSSGEDATDYPWGAMQPDANLLCFSTDQPCKVKERPPAAFGLYGIQGNVAEWTSTTYGPYPKPTTGDEQVVRGASWQTKKAEDVHAKRRFHRPVLYRGTDVGFRCARNL